MIVIWKNAKVRYYFPESIEDSRGRISNRKAAKMYFGGLLMNALLNYFLVICGKYYPCVSFVVTVTAHDLSPGEVAVI